MTKSIGQKIQSRRKEMDVTQVELAKNVGVTKQRICAMEMTARRPSADLLGRVADALDTSIEYFLHDIDEDSEQALLRKYRKLSEGRKMILIDIIGVMADEA
tara:strand:- start:340 stop:645 length:306 start_codon:yes stop_codon:yes gene_type:complete